jgi:hypothetical protein
MKRGKINKRIGKDLKEIDRGIIEVLSLLLPGGTEENLGHDSQVSLPEIRAQYESQSLNVTPIMSSIAF